MNTVMDNVSCLVAQYLDILKSEVKETLYLTDNAGRTLNKIFDESNGLFDGLTTEALQKPFINSNLMHATPIDMVLGTVLS